jgi:hypothetical protein
MSQARRRQLAGALNVCFGSKAVIGECQLSVKSGHSPNTASFRNSGISFDYPVGAKEQLFRDCET